MIVAVSIRQSAEAAAEEEELFQVVEREARRVGRGHREDRLHEFAQLVHRLAELFVGFGVERRVAGDFAPGLRVIVHAPQVVAVRERRKRAVEWKDFHAVSR